MRILLTGATGFIGKHLLPVLRERGHEVVVLTQDLEGAGVRLPILCKMYAWRPETESPPVEAFQNVDAVVHLAGAGVTDRRWTEPCKNEILRSRILSARELIRTISKLERKPAVFVSASGTGYYGDCGDRELDESSPPGADFLSKVCREWENETFRAASLGLRAVALRFGIVLGNGGGALQQILPPFQMGLGGPLGNGAQWMSWIHIHDAAHMILHAVENPAMRGPVNAVCPNPATNREFTHTVGEIIGLPAIIPVPAIALKLIFGEMSGILLASQKAFPRIALSTGYDFRFPLLEAALRDILADTRGKLQMEQWIPQPIESVFAFFSENKNLETITPEFVGFKILGLSTEKLGEGTLLDYRLKMHGIPVRWQSQIVDWHPPSGFSDIQTKGPYAEWRHTHYFYEKDGGTIIRDSVSYRLPFGPPGELVAGCLVRKDLEKIFGYRRKKIEEIFGR